MFKWLKGLFKTKEIIDNTSKNIDLGSSSVKYYIDGKLGNFISSVRRLDSTVEIVDQKNIIKVNGVWYAIGESKTPVSAESRKCKKEYIDIMCVYALVREQTVSGQYNINTLLPYNQLSDKEVLRNRIKGKYNVQTTTGEQYTYTLDAPSVKCEGQMSYHYIKDNSNCTVIINIGFFSTDIAVYKGQEQEEPVTIQTATNLIMNQYKHKLDAPNTSVLSYRLMNGDKFSRKEEEENKASIQGVFRGLVNDIKVVLRFVPMNSKIVICGGGAIMYGDMLRDSLEHKNVTVLRGDDAVYTDVLGLAKHCKGNVQLEQTTLEEVEQIQTTVSEVEQVSEQTVQEEKTVNEQPNNVYTCIIDRHEQEGISITNLCKEYGVSRTSFYDYRKKLVKGI